MLFNVKFKPWFLGTTVSILSALKVVGIRIVLPQTIKNVTVQRKDKLSQMSVKGPDILLGEIA